MPKEMVGDVCPTDHRRNHPNLLSNRLSLALWYATNQKRFDCRLFLAKEKARSLARKCSIPNNRRFHLIEDRMQSPNLR